MTKTNNWIGLLNNYLPLFILGWLVTDLRILHHIYFGKDLMHLFISVLLAMISMTWFRYKLLPQNYSIYPFVILVILTPNVINFLHRFPNYVSFCYYLIILLLAWLATGQTSSSSKPPGWAKIVIFSTGIGIHELVSNDYLGYLILGCIITNCVTNLTKFNTSSINSKLALVSLLLIPLLAFSIPKTEIPESQNKYYDPVVLSETTAFQHVDVTKWQDNWWYYLNDINVFSSVDYWLYYEPMVHPVMSIAQEPNEILIIGGENGLATLEVLKYDCRHVDIIPLDTALLGLASRSTLFTKINSGALSSDRVSIKTADIFHELNHLNKEYDVIIVDLPDPKDIITNQYYTREFYAYCAALLTPNGVFVTQSGSPYFAAQAFECIDNTLKSVGFQTLQIHNQIMTSGEWGWTLANLNKQPIDSLLRTQRFDLVETRWINTEAVHMMLSFGKRTSINKNTDINTLTKPNLYKYYNEGNYQ